ncbi:MAG: hemagglutinin, partial [Bryobacterales bacterium]|nr:hemagglutinin [Bryobacterales bacterium]
TVGQAYAVQIEATGGATPYTWSFAPRSNPSARFSLSGSGLLSGAPTTSDLGSLTFTVQVNDATGVAVTRQFTFTVQTTQPLALNTTAFPPAVAQAAYSFQLSASGGTPPYKWAVLPAIVTFPVPGQVAPGLTLDSTTGLVTGTPSATGAFSFTITLTDGANGSVSRPYTLTVTAGGPLSVVTATLPGGTVGAPYSQALEARGGFPPYTWGVSGSLPRGLTLDTATGVISGAPLDAATTSFTVTLADHAANPSTVRQALSISVVVPPPLRIITNNLPNGTQGAPYSEKIAASGGVSLYNWSLLSGTLPAGLSINAATGVIEGNPTTAGSSLFTIQLIDSAAGSPSKTTMLLGLTIARLTQVSITSGALDRGTAGTPYSSILQATGGASPYSWTVITGFLPPGLYLNTAGTLSGVPSQAGEFGFTIKVTDAAGGTAIAAVSSTIAPAPLTLVPLVLPSAVVGTPYPPQVLEATGGTAPYTFAIQGSGPAGVTVSNGAIVIAGTPSFVGTSNFNVRVTDAAQAAVTGSLQFVVRSAEPADLVLSAGSLLFNLSTAASDLPEPKGFTIASSSVSSALSYQLSVSPAAPWLSVSGPASGSTPNWVTVSLTSQALALAASATPYTTVITVTCFGQSPCSGNSQRVTVSLLVKANPPQLSLTTSLLSLAPPAPGAQPTGIFGIQNVGGGSIAVNSVVSADPWLTVEGVPSTLSPGVPVYLTAKGTLPSYSAGFRRTTITVNTSAGSANLPVTLLTSTGISMVLNPAGQQFQMGAGGAVGNPNGTVQVLVAGTASANWTAAVVPNSPWLTVKTPTGTSTPTAPGSLNYSIDAASAGALPTGSYYGRIQVRSGQVTNTPQEFVVVLNVAPAGTPPDPELQPGGLLFISNGTSATPSQSLTVYASSVTPVPYQAFASTPTGAGWLSVSPTSGSSSASAPARPTISVNPAGLVPGVYRGTVTYQFSPSALRSANITYIVPLLTGGTPFLQSEGATQKLQPRATCSPTRVVASANGLPTNFTQPAAWPTVISVQLTDDCGTPLGNGSVDVTFSSGEPPLGLQGDPGTPGRYSASWVPRSAAAQVTVTAFGSAPGLASARVQISGKVTPNAAPSLTPGGMLNVFNPAVGAGIAPGTAVQIYGSNLALPGVSALASSVPFPTNLSGTSVIIGGSQAPLYYVSPGQINALAPFELQPNVPYQVLVSVNGAIATPDHFTTTPGSPGIAAFANGNIIAVHLDNTLVTDASPAKPGEIIVLYLAGLGRAQNQPPTGSGAPIPPTEPENPITLTINGKATPTLFVGLTPGAVGLYQINFTVPADTPEGSLQLTVVQAGAPSNVTILPVRK